ncbi:hypothetical protein MG293_014287 [Ovis ammon polii]|uniref:Uncharacterized protein n=1 Tax=Ovis ammon polii TaxID=230172 RepID=A0AAD4Y364_OVIAM|nr:hypothetical protein MG293_014287 [Ovis ammon polii]KAI4561455.1 hypothetical protein MJT46_012145 [Ovis ammon polii x Ovis aries]
MVGLVPKDGVFLCSSPLIFPRCELSAHHVLIMGRVATETPITIQEVLEEPLVPVLEQLSRAEPPGHTSPKELSSRTSEASCREKPQNWTRTDSVTPAVKASQRTKCDCSCLKIALDWTVYRHHCLLAASVVWFVPKPETQAVRGVGLIQKSFTCSDCWVTLSEDSSQYPPNCKDIPLCSWEHNAFSGPGWIPEGGRMCEKNSLSKITLLQNLFSLTSFWTMKFTSGFDSQLSQLSIIRRKKSCNRRVSFLLCEEAAPVRVAFPAGHPRNTFTPQLHVVSFKPLSFTHAPAQLNLLRKRPLTDGTQEQPAIQITVLFPRIVRSP